MDETGLFVFFQDFRYPETFANNAMQRIYKNNINKSQ